MPIHYKIRDQKFKDIEKNQKLTFFQWIDHVQQKNWWQNADWRLNAYLKNLIFKNGFKISL